MENKKQVMVIHGGSVFTRYEDFLRYLKTVPLRNNPLEDAPRRWKDTVRDELGGGFDVFLPSMPNKQNAKYEEWKIWFERHFEFLRDGVMLVGHSQGGCFLAKYLSENVLPVTTKALFLVAAPSGPDDIGEEDGGDFNVDVEKLSHLGERVGKLFILHSKDDRVVPYAHATRYQQAIPSATLMSFEDRGHFLTETFPELIESIRTV